MTAQWQPIKSAPKDVEILVTGGELRDTVGSPSFGGVFLVYWFKHIDEPEEAAIWRIKAGFGEIAQVVEPTHWMPAPRDIGDADETTTQVGEQDPGKLIAKVAVAATIERCARVAEKDGWHKAADAIRKLKE
jgi:hypothetical protein